MEQPRPTGRPRHGQMGESRSRGTHDYQSPHPGPWRHEQPYTPRLSTPEDRAMKTEPLTALAAKLRKVETACIALEDRGATIEAAAASAASQRIQRRMIATKPRTLAGVA